jgi:hypothetical protein
MNIPDKWFERLNREEIIALFLHGKNILNISLKNLQFDTLQFLSLRNNQIKNINFLKSFPNLWFIDLRNNPIEDFEIFSQVNNLGFLGLSINKFSEGNFYQLKKMNIGILKLEGTIVDLSKFNIFVYNSSNNFLKVNDDVILFSDKFKIFKISPGEVLASYTNNKLSKKIFNLVLMHQKTTNYSIKRNSSNPLINIEQRVKGGPCDTEDIKSYFNMY